MNTYSWFIVSTVTAIEALGLLRCVLTVTLEGLGEKEIVVHPGRFYSVIIDGIHLPIGLNSRNPINKLDRSAMIDTAGNIWVGIKNEN